MFYGSNFDLIDLPLPRNGLIHDWALLHEESPKNTPALSHIEALELFNFTATFSRNSHFPLTLQYLKSADAVTGKCASVFSGLQTYSISLLETVRSSLCRTEQNSVLKHSNIYIVLTTGTPINSSKTLILLLCISVPFETERLNSFKLL